MQGFDIFLVILGLIMIAISYFISEKLTSKYSNKAQGESQIHDIWTDKDEKNIHDRLDVLLADKVEDTIIKVDDQLSQISNEKIMSVSEFSDQTIEKIGQNHTEVVFLYNMLNEKENEIKTLINQIDSQKAHIKDEAYIQEINHEKLSSDDKIEIKPETDSFNTEISLDNVVEPWNEMGQNNNDQILKLYKSGKSVIEIAKILELGQGEVKLVIDLSKGVKL